MSEINSDMFKTQQPKEYSHKELQVIKRDIANLEKTQQLEILKIIKQNNGRLTENKNGVFINLSNVSNECIEIIDKFVQYSLENRERLQNLEKLSENLFKGSMLKKQYDNFLINQEKEEKDEHVTEVGQIIDSHNSTISDNIDIARDRDINGTYGGEDDDDDDDGLSLDIKEREACTGENEEETAIKNFFGQTKKNTRVNNEEDEDDDLEVDEEDDVNVNDDNDNDNDNDNTNEVTNKKYLHVNIELPKRNKFTGRNARILKKCKELTRNYHSDSNYYGISLDTVGKLNNDLSDDDDDDEEDYHHENILPLKHKVAKNEQSQLSDISNELTEETV